MSRHGKLADDSARLNVVVPKAMADRIEGVRGFLNAVSTSDTARVCLEYGLQKVESLKKRSERNNGKRD